MGEQVLSGERDRKKFKPTIFLSLKYHTIKKGQVQSLYDEIHIINKTGRIIGFAPYCTNQWSKQKEYLEEYNDIPVMLNVMSSDSLGEEECLVKKLTIEQIKEAIEICNVTYLRFHEIMSYHDPEHLDFPIEYVKSVLDFSRKSMIPVFWNEWKIPKFSEMRKIINANVVVSFATNNNYMEPVEGYKLLKQFKRRGASVQSWYWYERIGKREPGSERYMPTDLMRLHTYEAFKAGCEVVQYEPMYYFIDEDCLRPKNEIKEILKEDFEQIFED